MSDSNSSSSGIGVTGVLGIVFIVLKLVGAIDWSWWWVLAPFWIGIALALVILAVIALGAGGIWLFGPESARRTRKRMARWP